MRTSSASGRTSARSRPRSTPTRSRSNWTLPPPETHARLADAPGTVNAVGRRRGKGAAIGDGFAWLARRALPAEFHDYQCGAKALHADTWERLRTHVTKTGFVWDVEVVGLAGALDQRVVEVPVDWEDRPGSTVAPLAMAVDLGRTLVEIRRRIGDLDPSESRADRLASAPARKPTVRSGAEPTAGPEQGTDSAERPWSAADDD